MSFVVDIVLIALMVLVVAVYAKRSIFSALSGMVAVALAAVGAMLLSAPLATPLADVTVRPLVEQAAAGELADMFSAPHLASGRETVATLPLGDLVREEPEAYKQLLTYYSVSPDTVAAAYAAEATPTAVLVALTGGYVEAISRAAVFLCLVAVFYVLLRLIARRIEQNFPPLRRYRGMKRWIPGLIGVPGGLVWSWVAVTIMHWVVPVTAGQLIFLTPKVLEMTDWYAFLQAINPLFLL